jgi:hypothetical protein
MEEFMRQFTQLNGKMARVTLNHCLFGKQIFYCDELQTINDDRRIGLVLKNQSVYVDKQHLKTMEVYDNKYEVSDDRLTITVNVNK